MAEKSNKNIERLRDVQRNRILVVKYSKGKVGYPWESIRDIYQHTYTIFFWVFDGCIGQYALMFW